MKNTVSAIITTFNREKIVIDAVKSVFSQTYPIAELIVVDDGSLDNTESTIKSFFSNAPIPCRYIKKENGGMATSLNRGIDEAIGFWIAFLDDDDLWNPDHIERCMNIAKKNFNIGCISGLREEKGKLQVIPNNMSHRFQKSNLDGDVLIKHQGPLIGPFFTPVVGTAFLRKDLFNQIRFSTEVGARLDIHFFWRISQITDIVIDLRSHGIARQYQTSLLSTVEDAPQDEKNRIALKRNKDEILMYRAILNDTAIADKNNFEELLRKSLIGRPYLLRKMGKFNEARIALKECSSVCSMVSIFKEKLLIATKIR